MAIRIAIANHKGGVAKSTTTMMVAEGLALQHGLRVLVIDMDPQCSVSTMLLSREGADEQADKQRTMSWEGARGRRSLLLCGERTRHRQDRDDEGKTAQ